MAVQYEGFGVMCDNAGKALAEVDYAFNLDAERGLFGYILSLDPFLPQMSTLRLLLADRLHFVVVQLALGLFNPQRDKFEYQVYLAADQPDDPNNLVRQRPNVPPRGDASR